MAHIESLLLDGMSWIMVIYSGATQAFIFWSIQKIKTGDDLRLKKYQIVREVTTLECVQLLSKF